MLHNGAVMEQYYITNKTLTKPAGPYTAEEVTVKLQNGEISPDSFYAEPGASEWKPVSSFPMVRLSPIPGLPPISTHAIDGKPNNYMILSVLVTTLCCLPLGLIAVIKSTAVDNLWMNGQYKEAREAAALAKKLSIIGAVCGGVVVVLYVLLIIVAIIAEEL